MTTKNGLFDHAEWRGPVPNKTPSGMYMHKGLVLHIMQGTLEGTDSWFHNPKAQVSAHFGVGKDGTIYQWVNAHDKAWAEVSGNGYWISVENEGKTGELLTQAQVEANAKIYAWAHRSFGCKLQLANEPGGEGLGYHSMGGADWGNHPDCPGHLIVSQRQAILDRAHDLLFMHTKTPEPAPKAKPKPATTPKWFHRHLRVEKPLLHGADVKTVQRKIGAHEDGWYGENTEARVKGWQHAHGLTPDGVVGPATAKKLGA